MTTQPDEPTLTHAADDALNEYLSDLREEVLWRASRNAQQAFGDRVPPEITVRDILEATQVTSRTQRPFVRERNFRERLLRAYMLTFGVVAIAGVVVALAPDLSDLDAQAQIGLLLAVSGLFGALASRVMIDTLTRAHIVRSTFDYEDQADMTAAFVREFSMLELEIRDLNARTLGESAATDRTPTLAALRSGNLPKTMAEELREIVELRNKLVHGKDTSPDSARRGLAAIDVLREQLRSLA